MASKSKGGSSSGKNSSSSAGATTQRQSTFFISGDGIDREVITTDICRYLGNDALVKPGVHQDANTGRTQDGFYITAYRPPTSAQLADLRADSQKWREERARTARSPGGYDQSATQQQVRMREDPRMQGGGPYNAPATYDQMTSSMALPGAVRTTGGPYDVRVSLQNAMQPPPVPYRNPAVSQQYSELIDYTYGSQPPNQSGGYSSMEGNRMDMTQGQSSWNAPQQGGSGYMSSGQPQPSSTYSQGRQPAYTYPTSGGNPTMPPYGRSEATMSYEYPSRDSGLTAPNPQDNFYTGNDDESMDFEETATQGQGPVQGQVTAKGQVQNPPRRERDRDNRDRHEEPRQKHRHR